MAWEKELNLVQRWMDETDSIALEYFRVGALTEIKGDGTPVTAGDKAVERALRRQLDSSFPGDAVLGEEEGSSGDGGRRWIVDPIDGTKNYARGIPAFGTLVALEVDGVVELGMVSAPALGTRWWAVRGEGAFCEGESIRVSNVSALEQADVMTGSLSWAIEPGATESALGVLRAARRQRGFGDFWGHALVAQGSAEAMIEWAPLKLWDIAAPKLIVEEAGGRVSAPDGGDASAGGPVVSSNGLVHDEVLALLA